jgi:YggT family protein
VIYLLYNFIDLVFNLLSLAILARALLSWFAVSPYHPAVRILDSVTDPILAPLRRFVPLIGMIDITPIVALFLIQIARQLVLSLLFGS